MQDEEPEAGPSRNKKHRKDKPWDTDDIDHWKIEPFEAPDPKQHRPFTEESAFSVLFPKYRETYLREVWGHVTAALQSHVRDCSSSPSMAVRPLM